MVLCTAAIEMPAHIKDFLEICPDGSYLSPSTPTRFLPDIFKMDMRSSDVIVVTWPKSGEHTKTHVKVDHYLHGIAVHSKSAN